MCRSTSDSRPCWRRRRTLKAKSRHFRPSSAFVVSLCSSDPRLTFGISQSMQAEDAKLRSKATAARQKSDEAKASHSASRSQGNVLSSLTKLKEQGRLAGFHVRSSSLSSERSYR